MVSKILGWIQVLPRRIWRRIGFRSVYLDNQFLQAYAPNSVASYEQSRMEALHGVKEVPRLLVELSDLTIGSEMEVQDIARFQDSESESMEFEVSELGELFRQCQSDKSTGHNYESVYAHILKYRQPGDYLVEIGVGSRSRTTISNMGEDGVPGASLRAFAKYAPDLRIIGADVDVDAISVAKEIDGDSWPRITYEIVDQLEIHTIERLLGEVPHNRLLVLIDDGLHSPRANINVLLAFCRQSEGRWLVVEDIPDSSLDIWKIVGRILPPIFNLTLVSAKNGNLAIIQRTEFGNEAN